MAEGLRTESWNGVVQGGEGGVFAGELLGCVRYMSC